ncbi:MAG: hypothetical protein UW44_C0008G0036 [Candidatus Collierbacteria bacterium GW2011_GWB2_44_22]|uniref:Uncharacterized protein n=1 Tax=Candidatus Collierbacteria bacterium GW2011_GWB2_44_22 TaxID=1618387 RepID=A0A0G1KUZ3_9BACT|nr:MAG: hypothetical protein UW44_C0008G0036 [Candidatus Collierbacteria bacterium GW2011_GWB2_44_22]KKT66933.1 MAG: hypothetical protein UW58_C0001G0037 [Candidatus Collierbacteria bacterium GW2011_GWC2_44_30]
MFEKFWLPEVPGSNKAFSTGIEVFFYFFEHEELVMAVVQMVNDGNAEDIVEKGKIFPHIRFGNVCFDKMSVGVDLDCLLQ